MSRLDKSQVENEELPPSLQLYKKTTNNATSNLTSSSASYNTSYEHKSFGLKFDNDLPQFPFVNKEYFTKLMLIDSASCSKVSSPSSILNHPLAVQATIYLESGEILPCESVVDIKPAEIFIQTTGLVSLSFNFKKTSLEFGNKSFMILFSVTKANNPSYSKPFNVESNSSQALKVVRYALTIQSKLESIWYRNEGGLKNCLPIRGTLIDSDGELVKYKEVSLLGHIGYHGTEKPIKDQSILKCNPSTFNVDKNGFFEVDCRIDQVSNHHSKRSFCISINPCMNQSPINAEIAPAFSTPIFVKSKRNHISKSINDMSREASPVSASSEDERMEEGERSSKKFKSSTSLSNLVKLIPDPIIVQNNSPDFDKMDLDSAASTCLNWARSVEKLVSTLEWQTVAFDIVDNKKVPIVRCSSCLVYKTSKNDQHAEDCKLNMLINSYKSKFEPHFMSLVSRIDTKKVDLFPPSLNQLPLIHQTSNLSISASKHDFSSLHYPGSLSLPVKDHGYQSTPSNLYKPFYMTRQFSANGYTTSPTSHFTSFNYPSMTNSTDLSNL